MSPTAVQLTVQPFLGAKMCAAKQEYRCVLE